jgi:hypothetical protein
MSYFIDIDQNKAVRIHSPDKFCFIVVSRRSTKNSDNAT